jgi:hypothetical protein
LGLRGAGLTDMRREPGPFTFVPLVERLEGGDAFAPCVTRE